MKAVVQRVARARVTVAGEVVGEIGPGLAVLVCALRGDEPRHAETLAGRVARYRVFADDAGRMNLSALDLRRAVLVVSQFTLAADGRKGQRPSFDQAAPPDEARALVERFRAALEELGLRTAAGRFGAAMQLDLENDGPATFLLEEPRPS
jgi:D-tyrosyl-tRNA(Tyr) deacylase